MSRTLRYSLSAIGLTLVVFVAAWVGSRLYLSRQVISLVDDLRSLDTSREPTALSRLLMIKYASHFVGEYRKADYCADGFLFSNRVLSTFHLAPKSEIKVTFEQKGDSLGEVQVVYTSAVFKENSPIVYVSETFCANCNNFFMNPHGRNVTPTWNGNVYYGLGVRPDIRRASWGLNPDCFIALRGCKDVSEILPTLWKVTAPGTVSSRVRSDSDSIAEAKQPLPD
jgi:hypothetical protein